MTGWDRWLRQPQSLWTRRAVFQVHLWCGIAAGMYILVVCMSGSILVYRNELYDMFLPQPQDIGQSMPAGFQFTMWLLDLHDNLLYGQVGRRVNAIGALLIMLMGVSWAIVWVARYPAVAPQPDDRLAGAVDTPELEPAQRTRILVPGVRPHVGVERIPPVFSASARCGRGAVRNAR